jgi:hypothetical protein
VSKYFDCFFQSPHHSHRRNPALHVLLPLDLCSFGRHQLVLLLEFELRASCLLGSTALAIPLSPFGLVIVLEIGLCFLPRPAWTVTLLSLGCHHAQFFFFFCQDGVLQI